MISDSQTRYGSARSPASARHASRRLSTIYQPSRAEDASTAMARYAMLRAMGKPGRITKKQAAEAPRSKRARPVSEMLPSVGGAAFRRFGFVQSAVVSRWKEIVGERYAGVSAPESIRFPAGKRSAGVLTLVVEGAHAPMMQHVVPVIVERVNRFFGYGAVERVQFKQGVVKLAKAKPRV